MNDNTEPPGPPSTSTASSGHTQASRDNSRSPLRTGAASSSAHNRTIIPENDYDREARKFFERQELVMERFSLRNLPGSSASNDNISKNNNEE